MPPSKRKPARRKAADMNETTEIELPDSSPSRASAKKRKLNGARAAGKRKSISPETIARDRDNDDDSGEESEAVSQSDLIDSVVSYLQMSKEPVVATAEYANEKEQEQPESMRKVSAYAKIAGRDWTYFVRDQAVNIGRPPDGGKDLNGLGASSPVADMKEVLPVHIDLGPSKIVSRHHASVFYDSEYPEGGGWHVRVNGRNGVRVNNVLIKRGGRQQIKGGAILEIAGTQMMFVTPGDKAVIEQSFIDRAKALATGEEFPQLNHAHPEATQNGGYAEAGYNQIGSYQSLAPAPPNFKRATTPPPTQDGKAQRTVFDSKPAQSPMYNRGMMMETTQEIDYSRDAAKDLKPPFSYATMIAQAIFSSEEEKLTLSNIYAYIAEKFAFYRHSNSGWQNSIRHNLSLNKAFQKVPRRTDEPGKGMKWQIAPEYRQEYWKKQARKGATSSAPSSPAAGKEVNPNFRGPNGQNLGYDITMVNQFSAKDMSDRRVPPHPAKMNFPQINPNQPPPPPQLHMQQTSTPVRPKAPMDGQSLHFEAPEDSPLPQQPNFNPIYPTPGRQYPAYTLPSSAPHLLPPQSPSNPTLSSSYLDTPFLSHSHAGPGNNNMMVTPAPLRQNPRLAPPSTLVAPSKYMPDSSPGGPGLFWKGLMGQTPGMVAPDISPVKHENQENMVKDLDRGIMSSSPPPMDGSGSPSKPARSSQVPPPGSGSIGKSNGLASSQNGNPTFNPPVSGRDDHDHENPNEDDDDDDDETGTAGFDLVRGFAPIGGSYSSTGSKAKT